ncbi:MAG: hypothetical protein AAGA85_08685 [Bacteroidota bacterium]
MTANPTQQQEIFFHVGLGKTGTTFLQYRVFPKLKGLYYIQRTRYKGAKQIICRHRGERILLSREFDQQLEAEVSAFSQDFPEVTPIVVFRRQDSYIASQYRRYVKNGYRGSFADFLDLEEDRGRFKLEHLRYMHTIQVLKQYFRQEPIVMIYEELLKNPEAFIGSLADRLSAEIELNMVDFSKKHTSYSEQQLKAMQWAGRFINLRKRQIFKNEVLHLFWRLGLGSVRYSILFVARWLPTSWFRSEPLIPKEALEKVRLTYEADWEACMALSSKQRQ